MYKILKVKFNDTIDDIFEKVDELLEEKSNKKPQEEEKKYSSHISNHYFYIFDKETDTFKYYLAGLTKKDIEIYINQAENYINISKKGKDEKDEETDNIIISHSFNPSLTPKEAKMENGLLEIYAEPAEEIEGYFLDIK